MKYEEKITYGKDGSFYLAFARFLQEIDFIEEFGSISNRKYEELVKNTPPYRDGKKGKLLERGKFYLGNESDNPTPFLYYSVPLAEDEDPTISKEIGFIGFSLPTIEDMRDNSYDFKDMNVWGFNSGRDRSRDEGTEWQTSYMNQKGIWGMFKDSAHIKNSKDFYGDYGYRFWELPEKSEYGLFNWWW